MNVNQNIIPTVSVFILVYNQEKFISQTLDSILGQKTNFSFQLVIGEDNSTDSTRKICQNYAEQFPEQIKLLPALDSNIGLIKNYIRTIKECDGKYIAICDGDDYWIDDYKLQKQVDFLETNPEFSIVYTKVLKLFPNGDFKESVNNLKKADSAFEDLIFDNYIPSVTALFKNIQNSSEIPSWISNFPYGDWPTYLWTIKDGGKIHFMDEVTAVYRMDIGISGTLRKRNIDVAKVNLEIIKKIFGDINFVHKKKIVGHVLAQKNISVMALYHKEKMYLKALKKYVSNLKYHLQRYNVTKMYLYSIYKSIQ